MKRIIAISLFIFIFVTSLGWSADIPKPEKVLGFKIGTARKMADAKQITDYFRRLAKASDRVLIKEVGLTTEGKPFIVAIISSRANHQNLETYRQYQQLLADPRKISDKKAEEIISKGKTVVMINCSLHATEIGASQMSMQLAYDLATGNDPETKKILDNVILLLTPMHNPDGIQMIADWYKKYLGTQWEGGRMPWLYQKYVGHDNNRDWYMFTQKETQLTIKVHNQWHPQIIVDMHQMGSTGARLFVPPYVDPYEPNVDPILTQQVAAMGTHIASELTAQGKAGVQHSERFDAWTPARAYHHYHGGIRILTEAASVRIATPIDIPFERLRESVKNRTVKVPMPWKGGKWTLQQIVDYDYAAARAALNHASGLRTNWLRSFYQIHKNAVNRKEGPFAFIIPEEQENIPGMVDLLNVLKTGAVEIHKAEKDFKVEGRSFSKGSYIVLMAQPYGGFAKALLERQIYPEIRESPGGPLKTPYDVVAHTLPLLMDVKSVQIDKSFKTKMTLVDKISKPKGSLDEMVSPWGYAWSHATNDDIIALNRLIKKGFTVSWAAKPFKNNNREYDPGTMIITNENGVLSTLKDITSDLYVHFRALDEKPKVPAYALKPVRLGLYKSWTASMDEGWTRWLLEQYEFDFKSIFDADIKSGGLKDLDVLIMPSLSDRAIVQGMPPQAIPPEYAGGISEKGVAKVKSFIESGGTLITLNSSAEFAIKRFGLSVQNRVDGLSRKTFFIPGSILNVINKPSHPVAYGFDRMGTVFFRRSPVFSAAEGTSVVRYPVQDVLASGWLNGEGHLHNHSAIVDVEFGKGKIILIGFPTQYRAQSQGQFRYLFNSIYYGPAKLHK